MLWNKAPDVKIVHVRKNDGNGACQPHSGCDMDLSEVSKRLHLQSNFYEARCLLERGVSPTLKVIVLAIRVGSLANDRETTTGKFCLAV